ncbi:site-specific integrase [Nocardia salmonicida]|uniref:site-specific integrase n=1 Tax=Nocardia salmonicida TaxID=53431 RepID=UPI00366BA191
MPSRFPVAHVFCVPPGAQIAPDLHLLPVRSPLNSRHSASTARNFASRLPAWRQDLDDIDELLEDFTSELRQQNKSKGTIDTYSRDVKYFREYLTSDNLPPTLESLTRQTLGAYIEHTLNRVNHRTQKPVTPEFAHQQYRSLQQFCKYLVREELLEVDPFAKMSLPTKRLFCEARTSRFVLPIHVISSRPAPPVKPSSHSRRSFVGFHGVTNVYDLTSSRGSVFSTNSAQEFSMLVACLALSGLVNRLT